MPSTASAACSSVAPPALVSPANGATGVPDGNFSLTVSYAVNPSNAFGVPHLTASGQSAVDGAQWTASGADWASAIPALAARATYTVQVTNTLCNQTYTLGSFTTQ